MDSETDNDTDTYSSDSDSESIYSGMDSDSDFEDFEDAEVRAKELGYKPQKELIYNRYGTLWSELP